MILPSVKIIGPLVLEKKILKGFYHLWAWRHLGHVASTIYINFQFFLPKEDPHEIGIDWLSGFRGEDV